MKNIVFIINSIGSGGAETALFNIINAQPIDTKVKVHLVLLDDEPRMKTIPSMVIVHQLNSKRSLIRGAWQCYRLLKKLHADVVVSFLVRANVINSMMRVFGVNKSTIICERMHLKSHLNLQYSGIKAFVANLLPRLFYKTNDLVLGVSSGVSDNLINDYGVKIQQIKTIYNPYDIEALKAKAQQELCQSLDLPTTFIVSVGRLTQSKDQQTLLKAYAVSKIKTPLVILGTGELLDNLKKYCTSLGIEECVRFLGYQQNPYNIIARARFFVSSSRNEGFPNALLEAMALHKACIFTSCDSGPAEIFGAHYAHKAQSVEKHKYGVLVPEGDHLALAKALILFDESSELSYYEEMAQIRAKDFALSKIATQYWNEILSLAK